MARIRSVKPEFWTDPDMVSLPIEARLFFIGMWNHADDYGVLKDDPDRLKLQVLPADDIDPHALVEMLVKSQHLLRRTAADGTPVLVVRTFQVHQKIDKRAVGRWGHPDDFDSPPVTPVPAQSPPIPTDPDLGTEGTGLEGTGTEKTRPTPAASARASDLMPVGFDAFWSLWPPSRRVKKPDARKAWDKALRSGARDVDIYRGVKDWSTYWAADHTDDRFIPHPATWLNAQQWNDPTPTVRKPETRADRNRASLDGVMNAIANAANGDTLDVKAVGQ